MVFIGRYAKTPNFPPLSLENTVIIKDASGAEISGFTLFNIGVGNYGKQFDVTQDMVYTIDVTADPASQGPFPATFQIHLAGNVGQPRRLVNGAPEAARVTRLDTLFNHPAPRPQGLFGQSDQRAQTALFKFANPVELSPFAVAVIVPSLPTGIPLGTTILRAPDPIAPLGITTPTARTPVCDGVDPTGMVIDFTQIPDPASVQVSDAVAGTVCAVIGAPDATSVTLPLANGVSSLIFDMGSGQEIVDGDGVDFELVVSAGSYTVAVSNTPYANTFTPIGGVFSDTASFDLSEALLSSYRYVRVTANPMVTLDAIRALNMYIDDVVQGPDASFQIPVGDVSAATITMRRAKAPELEFDPFLELIAPDGSRFGQNESGFGDPTSLDLSDAALINSDLTQSGFYRFLARGYDQSPTAQSSGAFFVRLESGGVWDRDVITVSNQDEDMTTAQKTGTINQSRQRDSYLFQAAPGQAVAVVVSPLSLGLEDVIVELYDPEGFFIAAADNSDFLDAIFQVTLPTTSFNGNEALPNPSAYRIVVSSPDAPSDNTFSLPRGTAHRRVFQTGEYEVKVFTGVVAVGHRRQVKSTQSAER